MPVPMQPPPYYTPFLDDQGNVAEVWKRFFLAAQTAITFLLQTQQRVGSMQGLMPIEDPADDRFAFVIPGPPGPPGAAAPSAAFGAGFMLGSMDVPDDPNTWFPLFPNGTTGAGSVALAINPAFIGVPTAPTPGTTDNSTTLATTAYVTTGIANAIAAVNPAVAVAAATTVILPTTPTYLNGVGGIGATITAGVTNTTLIVDGYTPIVNDRLLVKTEASGGGLGASRNGVYLITQLAALGVAWILTRALDYNQPSDMNNTGAIPVVNGTVNAQTQWVLTSTVNTVGTDAVTFTQFSLNPTTVLNAAGTGLTQTGHSIALTTPVSVPNGGTGATTFTANGVLYGNTTSALQVTAQGVANSVLLGNAGVPSFSATPTVTSVTTTGAVTIGGLTDVSGAGAGQVKFPATQNPSSDVNTLDDYKEGTWTPVDGSGASLTITNNTTARYIKMGQLVYIFFDITYPTTANGANAKLSGLPFAAEANSYGSIAIGYTTYTAAAVSLFILIDRNPTVAGFQRQGGTAATNAQMSTFRVIAAGTYNANA